MKRRTEGRTRKTVVTDLWENKATKCYSRAPSQSKASRRAHWECRAGPGDVFRVSVPLPASTYHSKDHEIFILSDARPHGQGGVTGSFNNHRSRTQAGCEGQAPFPAQAPVVFMLQKGTGVGLETLCRGPQGFSKVPLGAGCVHVGSNGTHHSPPYPSSLLK